MQLFPKEILEYTALSYLPEIQVRSKIIYAIILVVILGFLISLPFIRVDLYTSARGLVKPERERVVISSLHSGEVGFSALLENRGVNKGDTLLVLRSSLIDEKLALARYQADQLDQELRDLRYLATDRGTDLKRLVSARYQRELLAYREKSNEYRTRIQKIKVNHDRHKILLGRGVIAPAEFDNIRFDLELANNGFEQHRKRQLNTWQAALSGLERKQVAARNQIAQLTEQQREYVVTAPIGGNLLNVRGLERGSLLSSGTVLAHLTPDTDLIAEVFVSPSDIGLIGKNNRVRFQIDAYNYHQWGHASGSILELGRDAEFIESKPWFKVRCALDQSYLELPNGRKGFIKKGMTLRARFSLVQRTLYQLLYDRVDDWLHP